MVTGWNLKSNPFARRFELARRDVLNFAAKIRNGFGKPFQTSLDSHSSLGR